MGEDLPAGFSNVGDQQKYLGPLGAPGAASLQAEGAGPKDREGRGAKEAGLFVCFFL